MALPERKKPLPYNQVLKLVEQLTPEEQAKLRQSLEDQEDIRIADERLANPGKTWSLEELEQELDLTS